MQIFLLNSKDRLIHFPKDMVFTSENFACYQLWLERFILISILEWDVNTLPWRSCVERPRFFLLKRDISPLNIKGNYANEYLTWSLNVKGNYANELGEREEKERICASCCIIHENSKEERSLNSRGIRDKTNRRKRKRFSSSFGFLDYFLHLLRCILFLCKYLPWILFICWNIILVILEENFIYIRIKICNFYKN